MSDLPERSLKQKIRQASHERLKNIQEARPNKLRDRIRISQENAPADHPRKLLKQEQAAKLKEFLDSGHPAERARRMAGAYDRSRAGPFVELHHIDVRALKGNELSKSAIRAELKSRMALKQTNANVKAHNKAMNPQWEGAAARAKDLNKKLNVQGVTFNRGEGIPGAKLLTKWDYQHATHTHDNTLTRGFTRGRGSAVNGGVVPEVAAHVGGMSTKVKVGLGVLGVGAATTAYYLHGKNKQK